MSESRFPALSRRGFLGLAGAAAGAAALTACAGSGGGGTQGGDSKTITFWSNHPGTSKDQETELINRFQAKYPDLKVNLVDAGKNYEEVATKFNAALSGGDLPDVVILSDVWWFNYALNGTIEPLDSHFASANVNVSDYVDTFIGDYKFNGKTWALPYSRSTQVFYYNKDLWSKAGLPDRTPNSWDEFDEWGPKIQSVMGGGEKWAHGWGDAKNYLAWTFQGPLWTFGGAYSDEWKLKFNDAASIKAGNYLRDSMNTKKYASIRPTYAVDFGNGIIASAIGSTGDLKSIKTNSEGKTQFGTGFLPHPNGLAGATTGGAGLAIPSRISDARKENALKFIDFITNTENTSYFSQATGYVPVRKSAQQDPSMADFLAKNPNFKTAIDQLPLTKPQNYARVFVPGGDQIIGTGLEQMGLQNRDTAATFADITNQLQTIIDRQITPKLPK